jgi:hypothetical protein
MPPPAFPKAIHTRTAAMAGGRRLHPGSLRRPHSPGSCRGHPSYYCGECSGPLLGTKVHWAVTSHQPWPPPASVLPFSSQTHCPPSPFSSPTACGSTSGPRLTFPLSQEKAPLPAPQSSSKHPQWAGAVEGPGTAMREGAGILFSRTWQPL